jgi:O-antigen/teichoic acid export membrane protein
MRRLAVLIKNIIAFGLNQALGKMLGLFLLPIYTRFLSPSDYGTVELFNAWAGFIIPIIALGLHDAGFRFFWDRQDLEWHRKLTGTTSALFSVIALVILTGAGLSMCFTSQTGSSSFSQLRGADIYILLAVFALVSAAGMYFQNIIRARNQLFLFVATSNVGALAGAATGVFLVVVKGWGYAGLLWGMAGGCFFSTVFSILATNDLLRLKDILKPDWALARKLLVYGLPLAPNAIGWTAILFADRLLLGWLSGTDAVGLYGVAMRFASIILLWNQIFYMAWQYVALSEMTNVDKKSFNARILLGYTALTVVLVVALSAAMPFLYPALVGAAFHGGAFIIPILASSAVFHGISSFLGLNYIITKKTERALWTTLMGVGSNIAVCLLLIPRWGINGAAWGMLAAYALMSLARLWDDRRIGDHLASSRLLWLTLLLALLCPPAAMAAFKFWPVGVLPVLCSFLCLIVLFTKGSTRDKMLGCLKDILKCK